MSSATVNSSTIVEASSPDGQTANEQTANKQDADAPVIRLSATRVSTYLRCPRQYKYRYVEEIPTVLTGALAFGRTIHQVLHNLHQWSIYSGEPLNESVAVSDFARLWEEVITQEQPVLNDVAEIADYARLAEVILAGYVEANRGRAQPLVMEFPFEIEMRDERHDRDYVLCGVIDRIDQKEDGLVIVDYKSGKRKPSARDLAFDLQLTLYAFAAKHVFGQEIVEVQLYHLRDQTIFHAKRSETDRRQLVGSTLPLVVNGIAHQRFAPRAGYWCAFCEYKERCLAAGQDAVL